MTNSFIEENDQTRARRVHLEAIRKLVGNAYPTKYSRSQIVAPGKDDTISSVSQKFGKYRPVVNEGERPSSEITAKINSELNAIEVRLCGRLAVPPRVMGKAAFVHLSDGVARLQVYIRKGETIASGDHGEKIDGWEVFNLLDHGDFIGVHGLLFITKTGELSVHVHELTFLAKALLPMPDKMHGIHDPEIRQRQRYADLLAGSLKLGSDDNELTPREVFTQRAKLLRGLRNFLDDHGYIEVETPMLSPLATGAVARPFETYHNALDIKLYARIAPELYLKRLLVGGFEKVYELNRNFRNEGLSSRHNPEFTMLEFYCAYMDTMGMMDFCEEILVTVTEQINDGTPVFDGQRIDFARGWRRLSMKQAIVEFVPKYPSSLQIDEKSLENTGALRDLARDIYDREKSRETQSANETGHERLKTLGAGELIVYIFEALVERHLIQPTFITDFPKIISPLAKASPSNPEIAERFELYIAGMELANGFAELNDPVEQRERFLDQMKQRARGDEEAMIMDEDYIRALAYGMPPAAGIGIGIDRLVQILTGRHSIRDVILFPHMRPEVPPAR